ncbi:MAG: fructosamine kinase family protein [Alphaproteobacteria bacterium]|nr:fructosamine kinase family protein [Alphaproteobacteria bacterium]MDE2337328.1 fructosamine kinase family protein [Alphaproteobacteria bacterium]
MLTPAQQEEVEKHLQQKIVSLAPLSAANTVQIYRVETDRRNSFVAKVATGGMDLEAWMLSYLGEKSDLPVPEVYYSNTHIIIMQFVNAHHSLSAAGHRHAAETLAALHNVRGARYGLERDTMIGPLPLPNAPSENWVDFFAQQRLLHMAGKALAENRIDAEMMRKVEKLAGKLSGYIGAPLPPSLVHGDVWGGNIIAGNDRVAAFLDPAIYYADPEVELAYIRLLNTFDEGFFSRYNEINPIRAGFFEERAFLYSLYPLLAHTRMFGASYAHKARKILDRFV